MKKIVFRVSNKFKNHPAINFIQALLVESNVQFEIFDANDFASIDQFDACILLTNSDDCTKLAADVTGCHSASKPIVVFYESAKAVAKILKKFNPAIAISENDPEIFSLNKMGIETDICPADDFITDRSSKVLSSTVKLSNLDFDQKSQIGIKNLCKELVEMC